MEKPALPINKKLKAAKKKYNSRVSRVCDIIENNIYDHAAEGASEYAIAKDRKLSYQSYDCNATLKTLPTTDDNMMAVAAELRRRGWKVDICDEKDPNPKVMYRIHHN